MKLDKSPRPKRLADRPPVISNSADTVAPMQDPTDISTRDSMIEALREDRRQEEARLSFLGRKAKQLRESWFVVGMEALGLIGLIFAAGLFVYELRERQDERIARAWQLITTPASGNSGKVGALEYLNSQYGCVPSNWPLPWADRCWKESTSLTGIDLSQPEDKPGTYLRFIQLPEADLTLAILSGATLEGANFRSSTLYGADLEAANLQGGDLHGATLTEANFNGAYLNVVDLSDTYMLRASLKNAELHSANLYEAYFVAANFSGAQFSQADLTYANLECLDWSAPEMEQFAPEGKTGIECANLSGAVMFDTDLSYANLATADLSRAQLTGVNLSGTNLTQANLLNTKFQEAWFYESEPPEGMNAETRQQLAARQEDETWSEFVDRIMRERPELQWTSDMKQSAYLWD